MKWPQILVIVWLCVMVGSRIHRTETTTFELNGERYTMRELDRHPAMGRYAKMMRAGAKFIIVVEYAALVAILWAGDFW